MNAFTMNLPGVTREVPVRVARGLVAVVSPACERRARALLVADARAARHHLPAFLSLAGVHADSLAEPLLVEDAEASKSADALADLWRELSRREVERSCLLIAAGGGALLDLAGFLAATWKRGLPLLVLPTSLLAAVDASLGGKTAVNLDHLKNQVGVFHHPEAVLVDPDVFATLEPLQWRSGLGEALKSALLEGEEALAALEAMGPAPGPDHPQIEALVLRCLRFKARVVERDEREAGPRMLLNLGHTVGHVLESLARAQGKDLPHGLAVAAGLRAEVARFSGRQPLLSRLDALLTALDLGAGAGVAWDPETSRAALRGDKKRRGAHFQVPILEAPGRAVVRALGEEEILGAARAACHSNAAPPV